MGRYNDISIEHTIAVDAQFLTEVLDAAHDKDIADWLKETWKQSDILACADDEEVLKYCRKLYPKEFEPFSEGES
jgi:hypothetical protein